MDTQSVMASHPDMFYRQATGYLNGVIAAEMDYQSAGLTKRGWLHATDDYARGYRQGFRDTTEST